MVKKTILGMIIIILFFSLVSAINTEIKVKTLADHKVSIFIYPSDSTTLIDSYHIISDSMGDVSIVHSSDKSKIDVLVKVTKDGKKIFLEKFEEYQSGKPISIKIDYEEISGNYIPTPQNSTINETLDETPQNESVEDVIIKEEPINTSDVITGEVISEKNSKTPKIIYYFLGILVFALVIFFIIKRYVTDVPSPVAPTGPHFSPLQSSPSTTNTVSATLPKTPLSNIPKVQESRETEEAKRLRAQLESAQREIERLRNQKRIKELEFKLMEEKRLLEQLRKQNTKTQKKQTSRNSIQEQPPY